VRHTAAYEKRWERNLTLYFRRFLNTFEGMDVDLGFNIADEKRVGFGRPKPQIAVHVGARCQVHYEKASEKDPQALA